MDGLAAHAQFRVGTEIADNGQKLIHEHSSLVCKTQGTDTGGSHWSASPGGLSDILRQVSPLTATTMPFPLPAIQRQIRLADLDGWLLADFRGTNPVALHLCDLHSSGTRRWFLYIPATGAPRLLVHAIEQGTFAGLAASLDIPLDTYVGWQELHTRVGELLAEAKVVAMEFSANNDMPTLDLVGAGTIQLVREVGQVRVEGSQDLVQAFQAVLTPDQVASHRAAAAIVLATKDAAFEKAARAIENGRPLTEYELQQFIVQRLAGEGLDPDHAPIVAVNAHAADPHFEPVEQGSSPIRRGDILLIDLWGKQIDRPDSCFADVTWTAWCGTRVPSQVAAIFETVANARDAALEFMDRELSEGRPVQGAQVDDACRQVIANAGYGNAFIHRTGHSLGTQVHFTGVNIDNLETRDSRTLVPGVMFTIEPGIYLPDLPFGENGRVGVGIRSEVNCLAQERGVEVTTLPLQTCMTALLA